MTTPRPTQPPLLPGGAPLFHPHRALHRQRQPQQPQQPAERRQAANRRSHRCPIHVARWGGGGGWAVVEWQRNRTRRHEVTEGHTTQRHLITAKRDIVLAYLLQFGEPGARPMTLDGVRGAYLPSINEFVPEDVCRAELAQRRMITMEVEHD